MAETGIPASLVYRIGVRTSLRIGWQHRSARRRVAPSQRWPGAGRFNEVLKLRRR